MVFKQDRVEVMSSESPRTLVSVTSSTSRTGTHPVNATAVRTSSHREASWSWRPEMLTDMMSREGAADSHWAACSHARSSTQRPSGMMKPVSSASGMKRSGGTRPRVGWFQRTRASKPSNRPSRTEN